MRGVILAGGTGSRLYPSTKVTNKHLLPVFDKPMIYYPIETLKRSGIREILIVTSPEHAGDFIQLLGSGREWDVQFTYRVQDGAGGIAHALSLAEDFAAGDPIAVILSDNIFEDSFIEDMLTFKGGAHIFVKQVEDAARFGVVEMREDKSVRSIEEKPVFPKSNLAQTGFYIYDPQVFGFIRSIKPSKRGELEITDVNRMYLEKKQLSATQIYGMWVDAGTHDSLLEASLLAQEAFDPGRAAVRRTRTDKSTQKKLSPSVTIGLVTWNSARYLEPCITSMLGQDYENLEITVFDNHSTDDTIDILREKFPSVKVTTSERNIGFGAAHNELIRASEAEFYACLNPDMTFEPDFISELVRAISENPGIGSSGGKIKKWDFESLLKGGDHTRTDGKTNFIDSVGLRICRSHRFEDMGQGEVDYGQYDQEQEIFGLSGAAVLLRRSALEDTAITDPETGRKEFFDETMFAYKEDVDLAYRLQWAGWKAKYTPLAVAYHDRSVAGEGNTSWNIVRNRVKKSSFINSVSYLNHQILLKKNFSPQFSGDIKRATLWYNTKVFIYLMLFETETLWQWWKLMKMQRLLHERQKMMPRRVNTGDIERFMET